MRELGEDIEFYFVQTMPMEEKRLNMGWAVDESSMDFIVLYYEEEERARELVLDSDVVLFGWTEGIAQDLREERFDSGKLSFCVSERIYREGQWKSISPRGRAKKRMEHVRFKNKPVYLLCVGAYVASDFEIIGSYPGKKLKWGYFPNAEIAGAARTSVTGTGKVKLCWAGRMISLKHPEFAVRIAKKLKETGADFHLEMIGDGSLREELEKEVFEAGLDEAVTFTGNLSPKEVVAHMRDADIFLFTSNYLEGWGAVVNEAMQSGCAVVASEEAGAVPFLIKDMDNGVIYRDGKYSSFEEKVMYLMTHSDVITKLGERARETIESTWNAKSASIMLVRFCRQWMDEKEPSLPKRGPMSRAEVIKAPGFIRTLQEKNRLE